MTSGFRSQAVSDAFTRRQIHIERLKTTLHGEHDAISSAVFIALAHALSKLNNPKFGSISRVTLRRVAATVLAAYDLTAKQHQDSVMAWLEEYTADEASHTSAVMNETLEQDAVTPTVWPFVANAIIGASGQTPVQTLSHSRRRNRDAIKKLIKRAYALNWSVSQLTAAFRGSVLTNFKDGLLTRLGRNAAATVDTIVQHGMAAARYKVIQSYLNWVLGYTWVSILDGKTSATCRSLSGQVFKYGQGPIPPIHFRCRSHIEPVFKRKALVTEKAGAVFDGGATYYTWLRTQTQSFQNSVLGKSKARLFRKGGLSPENFAAMVVNARHDPLTLKQLRKINPRMFSRANV